MKSSVAAAVRGRDVGALVKQQLSDLGVLTQGEAGM
jgi:hypothetical protein